MTALLKLLAGKMDRDLAFRAFLEILDRRIESGRSREALRMLTSIGLAPDVAWTVVDGWEQMARIEDLTEAGVLFQRGLLLVSNFPRGVDLCDGLWPSRLASIPNPPATETEE